jgi:3-hydroxy-9,10-secoandrosta-1,3,5(10)-triene-9,17-dione monooxygenase
MAAPDIAGSDAPSPAELIARARAMMPTLAARSRAQHDARRILPETIAAMQAAGLLRVLQPARWGGFEMELGTFYDIQLALAEGDMSTGWTYGVLGAVSWVMGLLDDRAAREVWGGDSSVLICSSTMPAGAATPVDGGFRLSGRWRYASGCEHCGWAFLGGMVSGTFSGKVETGFPQKMRPLKDSSDNAPPDWRFFLVPRGDYTTVDTWQVAGLQGTGSIDVILEDVLVPEYRTQRLEDCFRLAGAGQAVNRSGLYRVPFGQIFVRGVSTAGIGALQAMLTALIGYSRGRVTRAGGRAAENPFVQLVCAETAAAIDEMRTTLHRNFRTLHGYADRHEMPPLDLRLRYKFQSASVIERCTLLAARMFKATGAAGLSDELPFSAILADLLAARAHISNQTEHYGSNWGGAMFGLENKDFLV